MELDLKLSVVLPVYNGEQFLPACLESIRRNHRDGFEFIIVDDHSEDRTPHILEAAQAKMPDLTFIRNSVNSGVAKSRNVAHEAVRGRYLTYVDADDWYGPQHLEKLVASIERLGVDFLRTDHVRVEGDRRTLVRAPEERRGFAFPSHTAFGDIGKRSLVNYLFVWAGIYDLEKIDHGLLPYNEDLRTASDRPWLWRMYLETEQTATINLNTYFYRKTSNPTALTQAGNESTLHFMGASHEILDIVKSSGNREAIAKAVYSTCRIVNFHVEKRSRLSPALRQELYRGSSRLLAACPEDLLEQSITTFKPHQQILLRRIADLEPSA